MVPCGIVLVLMVAGNAVSAYSAAHSGLALCREEAGRTTGDGAMDVADYSFSRGLFSQTMEVRLVTSWIAPDAEVTVEVGRPVFFLPWRVSRHATRLQPEELVSL